MPTFVGSRAVWAVREPRASTRFCVDVPGPRRDPVEARGRSSLSKDAFEHMLGARADQHETPLGRRATFLPRDFRRFAFWKEDAIVAELRERAGLATEPGAVARAG